MKKESISIIAIILGVIIIAFPMLGVIGASSILGLSILLMSIFLLVTGVSEIDYSKTKVGYEIPINRHFYVYEPPRPLEDIKAEIVQLEREIMQMLGGLSA